MKNPENTTAQLGRPVNMNSARQIRLAEIAAKREAGLIKRGRPITPLSKNQFKKECRELKESLGIEIKRGRPVNRFSARQQRLNDLEARRANGTLKLGRPKAIVVEVPTKVKAKVKAKVVAQ
jgi:hypothetical protein